MPFAGFPDANIAAFLGVPLSDAEAAARIANGQATNADIALAQRWQATPSSGGPSGATNHFAAISWGMQHLAEHPEGSKVHGGIGAIFETVALNLATGGLYAIGKGIEKAVVGKKPLAGAADAFASQGVAGNVLQPVLGTNAALSIEAAAGSIPFVGQAVGLLDSAPAPVPRGVSPGAPLMQTNASPVYFLNAMVPGMEEGPGPLPGEQMQTEAQNTALLIGGVVVLLVGIWFVGRSGHA